MQISHHDVQLILPEIIFLLATCVTLLTGLFSSKSKESIVYVLAQFTIVITAILVWHRLGIDRATILNGHYRHDQVTSLLQLTLLSLGFFLMMYSRDYVKVHGMPYMEYTVLTLFSLFGMMVLVSGYSFLTLYLGLELLSLPLYAMTALRIDNDRCIEASLKYFIMGAIASGMLLYGLSMLYGATQTLQIDLVAASLATDVGVHHLWIVFGLVFVSAGVIFKLGGAPFHMWVPDVYQGAPSSATLLIATAAKVAAFGLALRLLTEALPSLFLEWQTILIVVSLSSMALGNFVAIVQTNIKRMLAYSSIAHMGYMLLGLLAGPEHGYASALFYMMVYTLMSLGVFGLITLLSHRGFELESIDDFRGLNQRNPWLALMMMLILFSMAGIPPLVGFFSKVGVLEALMTAGFTWLSVAALIFAIVGAYYYIRIIKVMYFDTAQDTHSWSIVGLDNQIAISVNGLAVLILGIFPGFLFDLCHRVFH